MSKVWKLLRKTNHTGTRSLPLQPVGGVSPVIQQSQHLPDISPLSDPVGSIPPGYWCSALTGVCSSGGGKHSNSLTAQGERGQTANFINASDPPLIISTEGIVEATTAPTPAPTPEAAATTEVTALTPRVDQRVCLIRWNSGRVRFTSWDRWRLKSEFGNYAFTGHVSRFGPAAAKQTGVSDASSLTWLSFLFKSCGFWGIQQLVTLPLTINHH